MLCVLCILLLWTKKYAKEFKQRSVPDAGKVLLFDVEISTSPQRTFLLMYISNGLIRSLAVL